METAILENAIEAVKNETGIRLEVDAWDTPMGDRRVDATVRLQPDNKTLFAEIKKWAQHTNLGALIHQIKQLPGEGILVADYINPRMAARLREEDVQFIDTAGNAYINQPPVYVYVTGHRQPQNQPKTVEGGAKRAFEPKGLMVVYAFLCNPELVQATYREIAEQTGVALGTVGVVLDALRDGGFIRDRRGKDGRRLLRYAKLLERWIETWPEKLKPKQFLANLVADDPHWWKDVDIGTYHGYWGGEVAAAIYTRHLQPEVATVYLHKLHLPRLVRDARLRKADQWAGAPANVLVYEPFWPEQPADIELTTVKEVTHPILTYADLVATGDARNLEVAQRVYDEHIAKLIRED